MKKYSNKCQSMKKIFFDYVGEIGSTSKMTNFLKNSALKT